MLDKGITRSLYIETLKVKAFRTFIRVCSLLISERLRANIKVILSEAIIMSTITCVFSPRIFGRCPCFEIAVSEKQGYPQLIIMQIVHWLEKCLRLSKYRIFM
jgi:hypothetical protein